jgi:tRNA(adenine34) deaminase
MLDHDDTFWMRMAIDMAKEGKTPFGAVLTDAEGGYLAGFNTTILHGVTAHAEINVIRRMHELDYDQPTELTLYSTVEPCAMCMGAVLWAGIGTVIYGASIADVANSMKQIMLTSEQVNNAAWYNVTIKGGVEREACLQLINKGR